MDGHRKRGARLFSQRAGSCFILCMLCLANHLYAAQGEHRNTECLTRDFHLHESIDLGMRGLDRARSHFESEEYEEFEREILSYFARRKTPCRLDLWGTRAGAVREADAILDNSYKFWIYDRYDLPVDLNWRENPARSRNWVYFLFSFEFLGILNEAHAITGDRLYLERGRDLIIDFVNDNYDPKHLPSKDLSWYEHTVANRALFLVDFWPMFAGAEHPDSTFTGLFLDLVWRHACFLMTDGNYSTNSNHGLFNVAALLRISLLFPEFREASAWRAMAVQRLETQLADNVTGDGIHREYSPWYQIWAAGVLEQIGRDCRANDIRISKEACLAIERLFEGMTQFFHPDGSISLFGDSDANASMPLQHLALSRLPAYSYIRSGGRYGARPDERTSAFKEAGFFFMRSGWGKARPLGEETCLMVNLSGKAKQHDHYDSMSFEFSARGQKWITDLGRWAYEHNDSRRRFIISPIAHNIVVPHYILPASRAGDRGGVVPVETKRGGGDQEPGRIPLRRTRSRGLPGLHDKELLDLIDGVSLEDSAAVQAVIDTISSIRDIDTKIAACDRLLARNPRGFVDRLKLYLAFCFGEEKMDINSAMQYLEDIIEHGCDEHALKAASELLAIYRQQTEESGSPQKEPVNAKKAFEGFKEQKPIKGEKPTRFHWISRREYDYLEGGVRYIKGCYWSRAFLFIKPYHLLIIDAIQTDTPRKAKQFFHMPPSVSVCQDGDRYLLRTADSLHCIIKPLFKESIVECSVIEGQKTPNYQGWYSDTFFTLKEAPVIENLFNIDDNVTFMATLIVPVGEHDIDRYVIRIPDAVDWNATGPEPLHFEILEPWHRTTVTYLPSAKLCGERGVEREPLIEITRRMR